MSLRPDLGDCTIWLTRPAGRAEAWRAALSAAGAEVWLEPLLTIAGPRAPHAVAARLDAAAQADRVIATSVHAVAGLRRLRPQWSPRGQLFAVGAATARALAQATGRQVMTPDVSSSEGLLAMPALCEVAGRRIALLTGEGGRSELLEVLGVRGAEVDKLALYRRQPAPVAPARLDALLAAADVVVVTSLEAWRHLAALTAGERRRRLTRLRLVAASQRVVKQAGYDVDWRVAPVVIERMDAEGVLAALDRVWPARRQ